MPYHVGAKGSYGCSGYPALKDDGTVMGCHKTRGQAAAQIYAINVSEGNIGKGIPDLKEGDWALTSHGEEDEFHIGQVVHVMREGMLGIEGSEYALTASAENPVVMIQLYEQEEDGFWEETREYSACMMSLMIPISPLPTEPELSEMETAMDNSMMYQKATKPNYGEMIKPRSGGSTPANPRLYARIVQEAKDKFDVYPSAVANGWVVQEYKRRGGTYKGVDMNTENNNTYKTMWGGSIFDLNPFAKRDYTVPQRRRMAASGEAMPDGSYPIANKQDLMNAIRSWGRGGSDPKVKAFIMRRARALGAEDMIPENWK